VLGFEAVGEAGGAVWVAGDPILELEGVSLEFK
jgi:hypothetical protein